jgi:hypothetical protein
MSRLLLETDSPFMTPVPFRGKRNEPSFVKYIAEKIAHLKNITIDEVISMTTANAKKLFGLTAILLFLFVMTGVLISQDTETTDETTTEEFESPYHKFIGIGPMFGSNTIVETYKFPGGTKEVSYEGIFIYGGTLYFGLLDYCVLEATYLYSKNTKISEESKGLIDPYTYNIFELSSNWIVNPYSRLNVYGNIGYTVIFSYMNKENQSSSYFNIGLGFFFNLETTYGLLNFVAQWKLNFGLNSISTKYWTKGDPPVPIESDLNNFFSIPRFGIVFYPAINF